MYVYRLVMLLSEEVMLFHSDEFPWAVCSLIPMFLPLLKALLCLPHFYFCISKKNHIFSG